jgi:hypothetical protein
VPIAVALRIDFGCCGQSESHGSISFEHGSLGMMLTEPEVVESVHAFLE